MKALPHFCALFCGISMLHADSDWSEWRGPNGNGSLAEGALPMKFGEEGKGVVWKTELPGRACSTPVFAKGHLFLTAPIDGKDGLIAYDLKGKEKWKQVYGEQTPGRGQRVGSGANSSAVTDGEVVLGYFKSGRVVACTVEGKKLWQKDLHEMYGEDKLWWDQGTSPILFEKSAIIAVMQTEGNSYLVSFDLKSGEVNWKTDREFKTAKESGDSYTTPHLIDVEGTPTIVSFGADHMTGHNAKTGEQIWFSGGINPEGEGMWRTIASSVVTEGIVVVPHARGEYLMGLKAGGEGDITKSHLLWREKMPSTDAASPVADDGKVYILVDRGKDRGKVFCIDARTGKKAWEGRLPRSASTYYSSPILVGATLCCPREDGSVLMARIKEDGLGEVVENKLEDAFIASPMVVDGHLILRGNKFLWCLK